MDNVPESTFRGVVEWIRNFDNYRGRPRHEIDGESYYMRVNGKDKHLAYRGLSTELVF